jgi:predicted porin
LLGVGSAAGSLAGNTTTLGRIGTGFMYADWKSQVAYSSPNWNGFSFTAGVTQGWNAIGAGVADKFGNVQPSATSNERSGSSPAVEGKVSYEWTGDVAGKVWASAISQKVDGLTVGGDDRASAWDLGANVNVAGFGLTGYYGQGKGTGQTVLLHNGFDPSGKRRDSQDWYVQGTYTVPGIGTKLGVSYGESELEGNSGEWLDKNTQSMWTIGAYHPLTKHLNLVAEYSVAKTEYEDTVSSIYDFETKAKTISLGAILFF